MTELFRFQQVGKAGLARQYTFTLHSGETRLLQLADKAEKNEIIDLATGENICDEGVIEIIQDERRRTKSVSNLLKIERRHNKDFATAAWQSLQSTRLGRVGWVAANGGLISNLKIWENVTLPLWYHSTPDVAETEKNVAYWLTHLGMNSSAFADFMAAPPHSVELWQSKLAGLLRALVQMPRVLIVDAGVFEDVKASLAKSWISALEEYAAQGRAVLVLSDKATILPWEKIE